MREEEMVVALVAIIAVFGLPMLWIVSHYCYLACKHWQATRLVRDMVSRGYTSDEILEICQTLGYRKRGCRKVLSNVPPAKPVKQPAYA